LGGYRREEKALLYEGKRMDTDTREVLVGRQRRMEKALLENQLL
jgi:hypothetical protein